MRLSQYEIEGSQRIGLVLDDETIVDLAALRAGEVSGSAPFPTRMLDLIELGDEGRRALDEANDLISGNSDLVGKYSVDRDRIRLRAPVDNPQKMLCLAINQGEGWRRATKPDGPVPLYFIKVPTAITGPHDPIVIPDIGAVGCEVELAIIIGKGGKNIPTSKAMDHVFGFTVHNDITAHALRKKSEWIQTNRKDGSTERLTYPGRYKNFDSFAPMGPYLRLAGPDFDPEALHMQAHLDEAMIQQGNSKDYIYKFAEVIAYMSEAHTLMPGDIISSGTCPYVDPHSMAKTNLEGGSVLRSEIEGIGKLVNPIDRPERTREKVSFAFANAKV